MLILTHTNGEIKNDFDSSSNRLVWLSDPALLCIRLQGSQYFNIHTRYWTSFHTNPSTEERWAVRWYLLLENKGLLVTEKLCIHAVITQEKSCADSLLDETMGVNNGSTLLEEEKKLEESTDRSN